MGKCFACSIYNAKKTVGVRGRGEGGKDSRGSRGKGVKTEERGWGRGEGGKDRRERMGKGGGG